MECRNKESNACAFPRVSDSTSRNSVINCVGDCAHLGPRIKGEKTVRPLNPTHRASGGGEKSATIGIVEDVESPRRRKIPLNLVFKITLRTPASFPRRKLARRFKASIRAPGN